MISCSRDSEGDRNDAAGQRDVHCKEQQCTTLGGLQMCFEFLTTMAPLPSNPETYMVLHMAAGGLKEHIWREVDRNGRDP